MEYIEGQTLRSLLDRVHGVSIPQGQTWAREICQALGAIHEKGIVHRDLKPGNIMIDTDGHIKVMDFGIARSMRSAESTSSTSIGTPDYMSPEQIEGRPLGPSADIYALGAVLYELFTGQRHSRRNTDRSDPYLPRYIDRTIGKCLQRNSADRFQSAEEVIASLSARPNAETAARRPLWIWAEIVLPLLGLGPRPDLSIAETSATAAR
jgi:serine/threonine protein kinase